MGVMFVTHDFGVVADIADRVAVMERGLVVDRVLRRCIESPAASLHASLIAAVPHR